jgi:hypothetical protein
MWWRLTRAIIVSWLIGVMCGAVGVALLERQDQTAPAVSASDQTAPQTSGAAPNSAGQNE